MAEWIAKSIFLITLLFAVVIYTRILRETFASRKGSMDFGDKENEI